MSYDCDFGCESDFESDSDFGAEHDFEYDIDSEIDGELNSEVDQALEMETGFEDINETKEDHENEPEQESQETDPEYSEDIISAKWIENATNEELSREFALAREESVEYTSDAVEQRLSEPDEETLEEHIHEEEEEEYFPESTFKLNEIILQNQRGLEQRDDYEGRDLERFHKVENDLKEIKNLIASKGTSGGGGNGVTDDPEDLNEPGEPGEPNDPEKPNGKPEFHEMFAEGRHKELDPESELSSRKELKELAKEKKTWLEHIIDFASFFKSKPQY